MILAMSPFVSIEKKKLIDKDWGAGTQTKGKGEGEVGPERQARRDDFAVPVRTETKTWINSNERSVPAVVREEGGAAE